MKAVYIEAEGGGLFHLYLPNEKKCTLGYLRKKLTRGRRKDVCLKQGEVVVVAQLAGRSLVKIDERTNEVSSTEHVCTLDPERNTLYDDYDDKL